MRARWGALAGAAVVIVAALSGVMPTAEAATPNEQPFTGYATGTVQSVGIGAGAITVDAAWSGSSVASAGLGTFTQGPGAAAGTINNEMGREIQPKLPATAVAPKLVGTKSYGLGDPLNIFGQPVPARVQVSAPPSASDSAELLTLPVDVLAYADVLRSTAQANWNDNTCILGRPISEGVGYAADVQLIGAGGTNPDGTLIEPLVATDEDVPAPQRVNQSTSRELFVPQTNLAGAVLGNKVGLRSENRQIIAPVTLFQGTANEINIKVTGEWVLQAVAGGVPGSAYIKYGPGTVNPQTPAVTIGLPGQDPLVISTQDLLGDTGLAIPIPGLGEIVVGEAPRAINGPVDSPVSAAADGTFAAAAVDVVRVKITAGDLADIRIGHMEASARVPSGGIDCPIPVKKDANPREVLAGQKFTYTITVTNAFDCTLTGVKVVDTITVDPGITYTIGDTTPANNGKTANSVTWNDIGPIPPGQSKTVTINMSVNPDSAAGVMHNNAAVTASCAFGSGSGDAGVVLPLTGNVRVDLPKLIGAELPQTGGGNGPLAILAGALLATALFVRPTMRKATIRKSEAQRTR